MRAYIPPIFERLAPHSGRLAQKWRQRLLAIGCTLVLLLLGSSAWQATASLKALDGLRQQAERGERLDSMLIQLMDAENAVRGYLLSGNLAHLEPYEKTLATVDHTLAAIRLDLDASPANNAALIELSELVASKLQSLERAVQSGKAGEDTRIKGKRTTDRIRDGIRELQARLAAEGERSFERSTQHIQRTRWVIATLATGALALMAILFIIVERQFQLREQIANLLQRENQRLDAQVQERTAELTDLASYLTNIREAEKMHLARELHDELGALLTAAKMESEWVFRRLGLADLAACREHLTRLEGFLDDGITLKRRIIDGLRPPLLETLGLVNTLHSLGDEFARGTNISICLALPENDLEVAPAKAVALFRIAQEALTNIRKHADARQVTLALRQSGSELELEIIDDGAGFQVDAVRGRHHGLAGMKHRVQMCGGDFALDSQPGTGTRIKVTIPGEADDHCPQQL